MRVGGGERELTDDRDLPLTTRVAVVSHDPALLTALHLYTPESESFSVGMLRVQLLSLKETSWLGPLCTSVPSWYQDIVKGGEPDTLHSISAASPTTMLESLSFLEKVGGTTLSVYG